MSAIDKLKLQANLSELTTDELAVLDYIASWRIATATRKNQRWPAALPNGKPWNTWLVLAGRGFGKTRVGTQWLGEKVLTDEFSIGAAIAPTHDLLIKVLFEGESGLLSRLPEQLILDYVKSPSPTIYFKNGSQIQGYSSQDPERLRGPQFHYALLDEFAAWDYPEEALNMVRMCLRLGKHSQMVITTTPKSYKIFRTMMEDKHTVVTRGTTYDNLENLSSNFRDEVLKYEGTQIGRQEIYGEVLDFEESGIFKRSWLNLWSKKKHSKNNRFPKLYYVVQSYDTAFTANTLNDPTACTTWGVFRPDDNSPFAVMLLDAWSDHLNYPDLRKKAFDEFYTTYGEDEKGVDVVLIEDKGSGITLRQDLVRAGIPAVPYNPGRADKLQRAHAVSHLVKNGFIWLPESGKVEGAPRDWAVPFVEQVCVFGPQIYERIMKKGSTEHDDYVDTFTQMLAWLRDSEWLRMPKDPGWDLVVEEPPERVNPYGQ